MCKKVYIYGLHEFIIILINETTWLVRYAFWLRKAVKSSYQIKAKCPRGVFNFIDSLNT